MNLHSLLVPLDGSDLAENAMPAAACLAGLYGSSVTLFHVIEEGARDRIHDSRHLTRPDESEAYLLRAAAHYFPAGIPVERHVHTAAVRDVAASIAEHVPELRADLVILCAHGSGGARDWLVGNIAQQVISRSTAPVLLLRPSQAPPSGGGFPLTSILLPLDGKAEHMAGEAPAASLAQKSGAALHLVSVVPTPATLAGEQAASGRLLPGSTSLLLDMTEESAREFLRMRLEHLKQEGVEATAEVVRGDPAEEIAGLARLRRYDLLVFGTHGKAGTQAFWHRSVAARVLARTRNPVWLIPLDGEFRA
jgi:nucleotide-binding universal stress UspA family protein